MSLAELYPWLKALHVASAIIFAAGVLTLSLIMAADLLNGSSAGMVRFVRRWDQSITFPAMLLTWALGIALATGGTWFSELWLQAKFCAVIVLSGIHGIQSGCLRRLVAGDRPRIWRMGPLILVCIVAIAMLAVLKPA